MSCRILTNDRGFSLVGVMVSAAVAAIVLASMASMSQYGSKTQRTLAAKTEQTGLKVELTQLFNDVTACEKGLQGQPAKLNQEITIKDPTGSIVAKSGHLRNGILLGSVQFNTMNLVDGSDPNNKKYFATLKYTVE